MCNGPPGAALAASGSTEFKWNELDTNRGKYADSPAFKCDYCGAINRWSPAEKPPTKCRGCGAPEK